MYSNLPYGRRVVAPFSGDDVANNITRWPDSDPPNVLLAIDPGASYPKSRVPYAGCSLFRWGQLSWAGLIKCPSSVPAFARPNALVRKICEECGVPRHGHVLVPGIHPSRQPGNGRSGRDKERQDAGEVLNVLAVENQFLGPKSNPHDILPLAKITGALLGGVDAEFYSSPTYNEWGGSLKDGEKIVHERCMTILSSVERIILIRAQQAGDGGMSGHVLDSVGIGLYTLGRMNTGGVV